MTLRIVRLGQPRHPQEGLRLGTVRRPPRGVRKERYAAEGWFDIWYPDLAPSAALMARGKAAASDAQWKAFARAYKAEMNEPAPRRTLDLLAALSHDADFSVGCYCEDESRCHRLLLRGLFKERGAWMA
ncbi:MAG TPA: DUF488 family protein [Pseudolabrys sp.]|nr:DUF488 family protein [Pseudolabrys sp.]